LRISKNELLLTEVRKGTFMLNGKGVEIYAPGLSQLDISNITKLGIDKIIVIVTSTGIPIIFRGDLDTDKIIDFIVKKSKQRLKILFKFVGDCKTKRLSIDESTPKDWFYRLDESRRTGLINQLKIAFNGWDLEIFENFNNTLNRR